MRIGHYRLAHVTVIKELRVKNRYLLATSAFSNPELLKKCIDSWPSFPNVATLVHIDNRSNHNFSEYFTYEDDFLLHRNFIYSNDQRGCGGSWNNLLFYGFDVLEVDAVIIVGSDTEMKEGFLETFIEEFEEGGYEFATTQFPIGWNCWCMTKKCYDIVGEFDGNLWPCYWEDNDMDYRVKLSGLPMGCIGDASKIEHYGSATILKSDKYNWANCQTFGMNEKYYIRKWGSRPGSESYIFPYNNPELTIRDWALDKDEYELKKKIWSE